jgi:chromate transporter
LDRKLHAQIFIGFFRAGMLGYGGGPSSIPLIHVEVVGRYGWMSDGEFGDVLALANTLPGPIATKMAGYIGYKLAGWGGLINAIIATVLPTVVIMTGLVGILSAFRESAVVRGMTEAITPIIAIMLASLTYSFIKDSRTGLGWRLTAILTAGSFLLMEWLNIHPGLVIGLLLAYGLASPELNGMFSRIFKTGHAVSKKRSGKNETV